MTRWEAWVIRAGFALAAVSGIVYGVAKYFLTNPDPDSRLGHPIRPAVLAAHVLAAPVAVFAMGMLLKGTRWRGSGAARRGQDRLLRDRPPDVFSGYLAGLHGRGGTQGERLVPRGRGLVFAPAAALTCRRRVSEFAEAPSQPRVASRDVSRRSSASLTSKLPSS